MKQTAFAVDFVITAFVLGLLFGLLDVYLAKHHASIPAIDCWTIIIGFSTAFAAVRAQARGTHKVQTAPDAARATALTFAPEPALAVLYVFRDSRFASRVGFDLEVGGVLRAQTRGRTFVRLLLEPGRHRIASRHPASDTRAEYTLDCGAGQVIYLHQDLGWGWSVPRQDLRLTEPAAAQPRITACRMLLPLALPA
jgi:hypothetical protein